MADPYDPCPCGSKKKFRFCCGKGSGKGRFPIGTLAHYGPDDKTCTKIVTGVVLSENAEPILQRFVGDTVFGDPDVSTQIREMFAIYKVARVAAFGGIMGCPHEEEIDFPLGEDCPYCPFWRAKQGTVREKYL